MKNKRFSAYILALLLSGLVIIMGSFSAASDYDENRGEREERRTERGGASFPGNTLYRQECSSCHFLYHPGLLPLHSWETVIKNSDKHFGENLGLDEKTKNELLAYFYDHSAEKTSAEWADKILGEGGITIHERITDQPYIKRKHRKIGKDVFKRPAIGSFSNCGACHTKGAQGDFEEEGVKIPK